MAYKNRFLNGKRLKIFLGVASQIVPSDPQSDGASTLRTAGIADWLLMKSPSSNRSAILMYLNFIEYLGPFFGGRFFSLNRPSSKERQLKWMENCAVKIVRFGFWGLKTYISLAYYTQDTVWEEIGYHGPQDKTEPYYDKRIRKLCLGNLEVKTIQ